MNSKALRQSFLDFFESKTHKIVPSAPMVVKDDPTLMFTNAGMNQFKNAFLGTGQAPASRVADTQKCLRVSGKHNDLEEVGHDTYHHTMFEMLGNWSFGDYFKQEAIEWAWEYLTEVLKIEKHRLFVTVFTGAPDENLERDNEAAGFWEKWIDKSRILEGSKKDNFWEMGDQGPCGPCSEIHVDLRSDSERAQIDGKNLVNNDHPQVVEIWNLVFIQFNRKANGELEKLPAQHVDTGMGFERLAMTVQGKQSNYDTDIFQPLIQEIAKLSGKTYGTNEPADIAMRVIADHLRAVSFSIADGQLPSNTGAGYVIRRILRRAVRYAYTFLGQEQPFIYRLFGVMQSEMGNAFPELQKQKDIIEKVIFEEEQSFLRTLSKGIKILEQAIAKIKPNGQNVFSGDVAFELYDTYGFPIDLTELILKENGMTVDKAQFDKALEVQKNRSRQDAVVATEDWTILDETAQTEFVGYDLLETQSKIIRYRKITAKGKNIYHLVFDRTPFYGESGGQTGDKGYFETANQRVEIIDTQKEHGLIVHLCNELPQKLTGEFHLVVDTRKRLSTANHHTSTHLLHFALRQVLGTHVEQKGSLVTDTHLRFDFAHYQKLSSDEILLVEQKVNQLIRDNANLSEHRDMPIAQASQMGAMALFGEKYGDKVRVIRFADSVELCGGTHAPSTGQLGVFKITVETAIAAGIRRIEAVVGEAAQKYIWNQLDFLNQIEQKVSTGGDTMKQLDTLLDENQRLKKQIEQFQKQAARQLKSELKAKIIDNKGIQILAELVHVDEAGMLKDIAFQLKGEIQSLALVLGAEIEGKAHIAVMFADSLVADKGLNAGQTVKAIAKHIQGGGGGQAFFATAGGQNPKGLPQAIEEFKKMLMN